MKEVTGQKQRGLTLRAMQGISHFQNTYTAESVDEYTEQLRKLNITDLEEHAARAQLVPKGDRRRLEANLVKAYVAAKNAHDMASQGLVSGMRINHEKDPEKHRRALEVAKQYR